MRTLVPQIANCIEIAREDGKFVDIIVARDCRLHLFVCYIQEQLKHCSKRHVLNSLPFRSIGIFRVFLVMVGDAISVKRLYTFCKGLYTILHFCLNRGGYSIDIQCFKLFGTGVVIREAGLIKCKVLI